MVSRPIATSTQVKNRLDNIGQTAEDAVITDAIAEADQTVNTILRSYGLNLDNLTGSEEGYDTLIYAEANIAAGYIIQRSPIDDTDRYTSETPHILVSLGYSQVRTWGKETEQTSDSSSRAKVTYNQASFRRDYRSDHL